MSEAILEQLEPELRERLMAEAEAEHRSVAQIVVGLIHNYLEERRQASYLKFMYRCAEAAETAIREGRHYSNEEVEAAEEAALAALDEQS